MRVMSECALSAGIRLQVRAVLAALLCDRGVLSGSRIPAGGRLADQVGDARLQDSRNRHGLLQTDASLSAFPRRYARLWDAEAICQVNLTEVELDPADLDAVSNLLSQGGDVHALGAILDLSIQDSGIRHCDQTISTRDTRAPRLV